MSIPIWGSASRPLSASAPGRLVRLRVNRVPRGEWSPPSIDDGATGLLLIRGLLVRQITLGTVSSTEVVGPSDIIRPWEDELIPNIAGASGAAGA